MRRIVLLLASMALAVIFVSGVALADSPTTKEDCEKGGYAKYGFKNQGQCISAVNHATPADTTAPDLTVDATERVQAAEPPIFTFSATDASGIDHCECRISDQLGFVYAENLNCTSPWSSFSWSGGEKEFTWSIKAVDNTGNVAEKTGSFFMDDTEPIETIESGPSGVTNDPTFTFEFSINEPTIEVWCLLLPTPTNRPGAFAEQDVNCTSPKSYDLTNYTDGEYTFAVQSRDVAGNWGFAEEQTFVLDRTAP
jgi:hypothetical protein